MKTPITYEQIKQIIITCKNPRTKALLAFQYVLACRVGELVRFIHKESNYETREGMIVFVPRYETSGLLQQNIKEYPDHWEVIVPNFKQEKGKAHYKIGIIMKDTKEDWLKEACFNYIKLIGNTEQVFPFQEENARRLIRQELEQCGFDSIANKKFSSHNLRDSRADHLLKIFKFNIIEVQKTLGHKNLNSTQHYIDSTVEERVSKFKQADENAFY